ncbi:3-dehydroquinate dehydratase [Candidatus Lokiarchaeum ossiferum]|uniref:3-dehydroquinate dehydratase n=1 Tax=Candidatus Lokiarchaeum ossiferum TaxID=2951803 RepID=A0ABY6HQN5_9ARCH|nr:3-dehydroquinate dehydratase [Candidatus Lokiarchaeum sp. B-35]
MLSKTVLCLRGSNPQELLAGIPPKEEIAAVDVIEIRMDYLDPEYLTKDVLTSFRVNIEKPLIFTCRSQSQGASTHIPDDLRFQLYQSAFELNYAYVDIEMGDYPNLDVILREKTSNTKIILSYHDFHHTIPKKIRTMYEKMALLHPDIIKIVTFVDNEEESFQLDLLQNEILSENSAVTIFGMGEHGVSSRIKGYTRCNSLTYVSSGLGKETAVGQISLTEISHLISDELDYGRKIYG